ncbi:hypothetical protein ACLOJK_008684 [Asimina triloba]
MCLSTARESRNRAKESQSSSYLLCSALLCSYSTRTSSQRLNLSPFLHVPSLKQRKIRLEKGAIMEENPNFFPMSVERSFEAWEEMQRHGHDFADRLAQGFNGLLHSHMTPPSFPWPNHQKLFDADFSSAKRSSVAVGDNSGMNGVSAIFDIGNRLGQAGAEFGAALNGVVQQFFRRLPSPFRQDEVGEAAVRVGVESATGDEAFDPRKEDFGLAAQNVRDYGFAGSVAVTDESMEEEGFALNLKTSGQFSRPQGSINFTSTYDSRANDFESSLVARGDLWRAEASHGGSTSGNENSPLFLIQLGPLLFVRDTTVLLPVHLSKQHLLWYGFDRKSTFMSYVFDNGMHSLCPAVWSKHRRWLLMSMICLNPLACLRFFVLMKKSEQNWGSVIHYLFSVSLYLKENLEEGICWPFY